MRMDYELDGEVRAELRRAPNLDDSDIAVLSKGGIVTLAGFVTSLNDKHAAEAAARRVAGVLGVTNDIQVRVPLGEQRSEAEPRLPGRS
jgi:osmotically-inducible protein OsmY